MTVWYDGIEWDIDGLFIEPMGATEYEPATGGYFEVEAIRLSGDARDIGEYLTGAVVESLQKYADRKASAEYQERGVATGGSRNLRGTPLTRNPLGESDSAAGRDSVGISSRLIVFYGLLMCVALAIAAWVVGL